MVAHLLKPAAMERAADLGERLRAPTEAKRNLDNIIEDLYNWYMSKAFNKMKIKQRSLSDIQPAI